MTKPTQPGFIGDYDIRTDEGLRRLLSIVDDELGEERESRDDDFTAQEHLDVRMGALEDAVRHLLDDGP
jgi:hypothetical protein